MSTLSERARQLLSDLYGPVGTDERKLIEQALLRERRLAIEEAAKLVDEWAFALHESEDYDLAKVVAHGAQKLRVATPRGGE